MMSNETIDFATFKKHHRAGARAVSRNQIFNQGYIVWKCLTCGTDHVKPRKAPPGARRGHQGDDLAKAYVVASKGSRAALTVSERPRKCAYCESTDIHKFDSLAEARYASELLLLQKHGKITGLVFHPALLAAFPPATAEGKSGEIAYTPDGAYIEQGRLVYYDVKPKGAPRMESDFLLRKKIIETAHGIKIHIVRR